MLTQTQARHLEAIRPLFRAGVAPTLDMIAQRCGLSGRSRAHYVVADLIAAGRLRKVETSDLAEDLCGLAGHYDFEAVVLSLDAADVPPIAELRTLRRAGQRTPVMALSRVSSLDAEIEALAAGADDFIRKPFHRDVLLHRLNALIRRSAGQAEAVLRIGGMEINTLEKRVRIDGQPIRLTGKEYQLVEAMALRPGATMTKGALMSQLYGGPDEPELKIIDVFVCKIRNKLRPFHANGMIETVWGRGYKLVAPVEVAA